MKNAIQGSSLSLSWHKYRWRISSHFKYQTYVILSLCFGDPEGVNCMTSASATDRLTVWTLRYKVTQRTALRSKIKHILKRICKQQSKNRIRHIKLPLPFVKQRF